jgi:AcrR family transcriptional regulator
LVQIVMEQQDDRTCRRIRADSVRNRERLLVAAAAIFGAGGQNASLEAVARRAGVGIGTLYRHFPTREALFEAVYRHEVDHLAEYADRLAGEADSLEALRQWLYANIQLVVTKKGMSAALALAANGSSELHTYSFTTLTKAIAGLLDRAIAEGRIRPDIKAEELLRTLVGLCSVCDRPGWQAAVLHMVDIFLDGLRHRPENGLP